MLICDDSTLIRKIFGKYLTGLKCDHCVCSDGQEAADWFKDNYRDCAGIVTDMEMPRLSGFALIRFAQALCPGIPCFIVSGNHIPITELPAGVRRAVVKPIVAEKVEEIIGEIFEIQNATTVSTTAAAAIR